MINRLRLSGSVGRCAACGSRLSVEAFDIIRQRGLPGQLPPSPTLEAAEGYCGACNQRIRPLNPHKMDAAKCEVLEAMAKLHALGHEWVKVGEGRSLDAGTDRMVTAYRAGQHVGRLKWFGLVEHRGRRTGEYQVNRLGYSFLVGVHRVPAVIYCRDGVVEHRSEETISVIDAWGKILDEDYWDSYSREQVPAPHPKREATR